MIDHIVGVVKDEIEVTPEEEENIREILDNEDVRVFLIQAPDKPVRRVKTLMTILTSENYMDFVVNQMNVMENKYYSLYNEIRGNMVNRMVEDGSTPSYLKNIVKYGKELKETLCRKWMDTRFYQNSYSWQFTKIAVGGLNDLDEKLQDYGLKSSEEV